MSHIGLRLPCPRSRSLSGVKGQKVFLQLLSNCLSKYRVDTVREKYLENEICSRSGKSQGILWMAREI